MLYWLKKTSLIILFLILFSCEEKDDETESLDELNYKILTDTNIIIAPDTFVSQADIVFIDSNNSQNFLNKDGSYEANWNMLADAKFENTYFPKHNASGYYVDFGKSPLFLQEKTITLEGYMIPFLVDTANGNYKYVISKLPNSACFFCGGGGGPETVAEIFFKPGHRTLREDEYLTVKGRFVLNNGNPWMVNYLIYEGEVIE